MISVVVFAAPGRDLAHERTFRSIEASDIGKAYEVSMHPDGMTALEHWRKTHELAAASGTDLVLVLEDDVLVNRFILENIASWRWPLSRDFGAGWVYSPGGIYSKDDWYQGTRPWAMTCGVVYRTADLPGLIDLAWQKMTAKKDPMPWDCAVAWAATGRGKRIRVHFPSLVEHQNDVPSKVGNPSRSVLRTSRGTFRENWRRPRDDQHGKLDQFGRVVVMR